MQRIVDLIILCILFIPLTLTFFVISLLILIIDGSPLLFLHYRIGKDGKRFLTYKFKTYQPIQKKEDYIVVDHKRAEDTVTRLGRILRDHGLDELPQIINILLGQMTFIGPRPLVDFTYEDLKKRYPNKVSLIESWRINRLKYVPGLSGWHQIHINDPHVIKYEEEYFTHPSFKKKLKIIIDSMIILILGKSYLLKEKVATSNQYEV